MAIEVTVKSECTILSFNSNKFTKCDVDEFKKVFEENFNKEVKVFIVDFKQIEFMDSSALGALVNSLKQLEPSGDLLVVSLSQPVLQLFKLTRMDHIFKVFDNIESAYDHVKSTNH